MTKKNATQVKLYCYKKKNGGHSWVHTNWLIFYPNGFLNDYTLIKFMNITGAQKAVTFLVSCML